MEEEPVLFVWRDKRKLSPSYEMELLARRTCPYCSARVRRNERSAQTACPLCGWKLEYEDYEDWSDGLMEKEFYTWESVLRKFKISSSRVALVELGTHLRRHFSDIYRVPSYRFEELVGDVFQRIGYRIEMTKKSRDGGVDLFLLSGTGDRLGIVQCKRYRQDRRVGISVISELLGTQLVFDVKTAILVTTSTFTQPARSRALAPGVRRHGFEVDLWDASDLLRALKVYNAQLPPLDRLTESFLRSHGIFHPNVTS